MLGGPEPGSYEITRAVDLLIYYLHEVILLEPLATSSNDDGGGFRSRAMKSVFLFLKQFESHRNYLHIQ